MGMMEEAPHKEVEEAEHHRTGSKKIALLIAILALCLAVSETFSKNAQTTTLTQNIEAANLWAFFQSKTIRITTIATQADAMETMLPQVADAAVKQAMQAQIGKWRKDAERYDSEPHDGRKDLSERATQAEKRADRAEARHHSYELSSAAFQIAIVLSSAAIITGMMVLAVAAGALGAVGVIITGLGFFAPHLLDLI
jgi:hypothetical protein